MADPRKGLGFEVAEGITGPFEPRPAKRAGDGSDGGTLDVGIVARLPDGTRVVIGEIWAACPDEYNGKSRIDAGRIAGALCDALNEEVGRIYGGDDGQ